MSDMRDLLEKMSFAGQAAGQKPGDQVRGSEPMPKKGGGKKHPYAGRLVGDGGTSESIEEEIKEEFEKFVAEYGAPGTAIGSAVGQDPRELAALRQQQTAGKAEVNNQVSALNAQVTATRRQLSQLNQAFPQGANPVEKSMALQQMQAQKVQLNRQIEDLMQQISAMKQQAR